MPSRVGTLLVVVDVVGGEIVDDATPTEGVALDEATELTGVEDDAMVAEGGADAELDGTALEVAGSTGLFWK